MSFIALMYIIFTYNKSYELNKFGTSPVVLGFEGIYIQ
jgi:hypothetical protein